MDTLYIAEDNELDQRIIRFTLARYPLFGNILFFNNGLALLNYLKSNRCDPLNLPDIILLDLQMPVLDGWDFLEEFDLLCASFSKTIQVYVVTVSINPSDIKRAMAFHFVRDFISKPVTKEKLATISGQVFS